MDRPPLDAARLRRALVAPGGLWTSLEVVAETGSTNSDLAERARAGAQEGAVLVAERQIAGRGRLDRRWTAPARSGLFLSLLLRPGPGVPPHRYGWMPLLAGVAAASALSRIAEVEVGLKWPNDLLVTVDGEERKLGGVLTELADGAVVPGIGVNVSLRAAELPVPGAGSLALAGAAVTDRDTLLRALLRSFAELYEEWRRAGGDPEASGLLPAYTARCTTVGRRVRVLLPGDRALEGRAVAVDGDGRLVVRTGDGAEHAVSAGDVVHVRPQPEEPGPPPRPGERPGPGDARRPEGPVRPAGPEGPEPDER
ncbi:biotin--[acetyl-CoA-carboxylase] ligase [Streptacidiphilus sp. ASG 303]|uniref:biotin--[acetyl-CoA-carboxylase] ligase n=1 Tax=Streptacidiphilus sp. ASG 303 TaxID=2896847 RepID=UPI001E4AD6D5|nr:biotin--[acetyl-CoA-carboxylase] ligase [Streptacidiphilus sp. ASG 303]MCD0481826.1 biotin--[acetyl-CoA-carboxylase] ligase [Streptacidiphilus sp. ASG 303]